MKKDLFKKVSVVALSAAMVVSCLAYAPMASAETDSADSASNFSSVDLNAETSEYGLKGIDADTFAAPASDEMLDKSTALPATWDSRKKGWVTSVKNQGQYGTCWSFAANAAMESNLIKKGIKVNGKKATKSNLNFSEKHTAYFCYHPFNDPLKNNGGDSASFNPSTAYLNFGGNGLMASVTIANGEGPVAEKVVPYNGNEVAKKHDYKAAAHLKDMKILNMTDASGNPRLKAIKEAIKNYGAVVLTIGWYGECEDADGDYYCPVATYTNHDITLVGWNDNYSKNNFTSAYGAPPKNGAWLIKNSWGTGVGKSGYYWVSYYDQTLSFAWAYNMVSKSSYKNNYFYSNMPNMSAIQYSGSGGLVAANTYTISGKEKITSVGFGTLSGSIKYSIQLYKNSKAGNPTSGKKLLSTPLTGKAVQGYTTVNLKKAINVAKGDKISVVITVVSTDGYYPNILTDVGNVSESGAYYTAGSVGMKCAVKDGSTWLSTYDLYDMGATEGYSTHCINLYTKNR